MSQELEKAFQPASLGKLQLKNRILKAATYEGKTPDGIPGQALLEFHRQVVQGGTAMTTIGYCTTEADGRINDQMMWLHEGIRAHLQDLTAGLKLAAPQHMIVADQKHIGVGVKPLVRKQFRYQLRTYAAGISGQQSDTRFHVMLSCVDDAR